MIQLVLSCSGTALQAMMDFFQALVTSGNSDVGFRELYQVGQHQHTFLTLNQLWKKLNCSVCIRAWPIHRQHLPSGPIVGQSEPSANDDNRWPVCSDVSRWCYSL